MFDWLAKFLGLASAPPTAAPLSPRAVRNVAPVPLPRPTIAIGRQSRDITGESRYMATLQGLMRGPLVRREGDWLVREVLVTLVREPAEGSDPPQLRVEIDDLPVGYVPRAQVADFAPVFAILDADGVKSTCSARVVGKDGCYGVKLQVTQPLWPMHDPDPVIVGPTRVAVIGEEDHQEELVRRLAGWPYRKLVAELREAAGSLEVMIRGQLVGRLSERMSERYLPSCRRHSASRSQVTCWAEVSKGARKIEVHVLLRDGDQSSRRSPRSSS